MAFYSREIPKNKPQRPCIGGSLVWRCFIGPKAFFGFFFEGGGCLARPILEICRSFFCFYFFIHVVMFSPHQNIFVEYSFRNIIVQV